METQTPQELLATGRRELVCKNISKAVELLGEACEKLSKEHGDLAPELAEPNFYYGCALLELARMESAVIGDALDGIPVNEESESDNEAIQEAEFESEPEMTEAEKETLSEQIIDAMCEPREGEPKPEEEKNEEKDEEGEKVDSAEEATEEAEDATAEDADQDADEAEEVEGEQETPEKEDIGEENEEENLEDDVDNLQLAWELFEVAKQIYSTKDTADDKIKVTDCYEKLAEISREKEDYEQSLDDLKECLRLRKELVDIPETEKVRLIAETEYQMGTTCYVASWLDRASEYYRSAHKELEKLCENDRKSLAEMKSQLETAEESAKAELETKIKSLGESVTDLEDIINEIKTRCGEVDEDRLDEKMSKEKHGSTSNGFGEAKSDVPTDDITHLVRKKRAAPTEEADSAKENNPEPNGDAVDPSPKKSKLANGTPAEAEETPVA